MTPFLGLSVMLAAFWLLLSGHYAPLFLALGAASVLLVTWLAWRMEIVDDEGRPLDLSLRAPRYWAWLSLQILRSALLVSRRIWSAAPVQPGLTRTSVVGMTDVERVTYANSITLTPGTLAVSVEDEHIEVHALDPASFEELRHGEMARRVRRMDPH